MVPQTKAESSSRERFVTIREASEILRISQVTVGRLLRDGKLKKLKVGRRTLIRKSDVEDLVQEA